MTAVAVDAVCWLVGLPALLYVGFAACAHNLLASPRRAWLWPASVLLGLSMTGVLLTTTPSAYCYT